MGKRPKVEVDNSGVAAAQEAQAAAVREQTAAQEAQAASAAKAAEARRIAEENAATLASNMGRDLKGDNVAQVIAGGSAAENVGTPTSTLKKKRLGGTLSSQLGVNV